MCKSHVPRHTESLIEDLLHEAAARNADGSLAAIGVSSSKRLLHDGDALVKHLHGEINLLIGDH